MPKTKLLHKSFKVSPQVIALYLVAGFLIVGGIAYASMQKSTVNMIGEEPNNTGAYIGSKSRDCASISSFSVSGNCGNNSYQTISFTCGMGTAVTRESAEKREIGVSVQNQAQVSNDEAFAKKSCKPYTNLYNEAQATCAASCPQPTLIPTSIPEAMPTLTPIRQSPTPTPTPARVIRREEPRKRK